jgi:hypothetical protein
MENFGISKTPETLVPQQLAQDCSIAGNRAQADARRAAHLTNNGQASR